MASTSGAIIVVSHESLMSEQGNSHDNLSCDESQEYLPEKDSTEHIFYKRLVEYDDMHAGSNRKPWTQARIEEVIAALKNIKVSTKKKTVDYYWMGKYEVITTATGEYLTFKKKNSAESSIRIVPREQYFDIISEVHTACGHGGRDKILYDIKSKYYIPKKAVEIFVSVCPVCESKRSTQKSDIGTRSLITRNLNATGDLNMIDLQAIPDGEYKWILHYYNLDSKYTILRPLKTIHARDVAYELLTIFLTLGAPHTIQSIIPNDLMKNILDEFLTMWPDCKIEYKAVDNIGNSSEEIQTMLRSWMKENNSVSWSVGCLFVQYKKNTLLHQLAENVPFETLSGRNYGLIRSKTNYDASSSAFSMPSTNESEKEISAIPKQQSTNTNFNVCSDADCTLSTPEPEKATSPIMNIKQEVEVEFDSTSPDNIILSATDKNIEQHNAPSLHNSENDDFYKCQSCNSTLYVIRGIIETELGKTIKVSCCVCKTEQEVEIPENKGVKRPAEDKIECIPKKIAVLEIGHSVIVSVPKAFQGPFNTKTIKGKIVDFRNGVYRVATKIGTMKNWFSGLDLIYTETEYGDVSETPITLEEAVANQPDGPSVIKCNCKPAINQCHNNRCVCFKNNVLCGSKCHQNMFCVNT